MELISPFNIPSASFDISPEDKVGLVGSCFSENISRQLQQLDFPCWQNPLGTLYHPLCISHIIKTGLQETFDIGQEDIYYHDGLAFSMNYPYRWKAESPDKITAGKHLNPIFSELHNNLKGSSYIFITWGTSLVYRLKENGKIIGNCHKLPAASFQREALTVETIIQEYLTLIELIKQVNPKLKVILTISPVRHWRDGFIENQESKARLLLAKHALCQRHPEIISYFPAYEIMMDELRDYRFYEKDLFHPNALAVEYIFEKFSKTYFSSDTIIRNSKVKEFKRALSHRLLNPAGQEAAKFKDYLLQLAAKLDQGRDHPIYLNLAQAYIKQLH